MERDRCQGYPQRVTLIRWLDSFNIGIPEIDAEHRELVDLINSCHQRLLDPDHDSDVGDFLGLIYTRIEAHFSHEEVAMMRIEFPEYWPHKADHERLLDDLKTIIRDWESSRTLVADHLSKRLERWFTVHFRSFDARLHRFVDQCHTAQP
jgi:hemerythrin